MDFRFKVMGDRLRGISLGSSGDPIIHMWIMDGCVCVYTVRVVSLCVLGVFLSLLLPGSSRQAGPGTEGACARLSPTRRTEARGLLGLADGAYGGARPGEGPGGGSCLYLGVRTTAATPNGGGFVKASRRSERRTHGLGCSMAP